MWQHSEECMCRLRNIALESVPEKFDRRTDRQMDGQTDDGQSDLYVPLCFAGNTKSVNTLTARMILAKNNKYYISYTSSSGFKELLVKQVS